LINAVYNKANILVIIMDNASTAMTGHQPTPLTGLTAKGEEGGKVILEEICKASGVKSVTTINPYKAEENARIISEKLAAEGVHVIISCSPCILTAKKK
jgi:indolepyruvate ferredoxin oxidoreductase alpha subunit